MNLDQYRGRLIEAFPPRAFYGTVSTHDECDEGIALRSEVPGKRWDEIPREFIDFNSGSLPLLEPDAMVAFLPAWLLRAAETLDQESVLAELTLYFLCPGDPEEGWDEDAIARLAKRFTDDQRNAVAEFLQWMGDSKEWFHAFAAYGLKWWAGPYQTARE